MIDEQIETISTWKELKEIYVGTLMLDKQNSDVQSEFGKCDESKPLESPLSKIIEVKFANKSQNSITNSIWN